MAAIHDVMNELNDLLPTLPPRVAAVLGGAEEVTKLADEVLKDFEETDQDADQLFDKIKLAMDELDKEAENHLQTLQAAIDDLENTALEPMEKELEAARTEIQESVQNVETAMSNLRQLIEQEIKEVEQGAEEFKAGMEQVGATIESGRARLTAALAAAKDEADNLQEMLNTSKATLNQEVANLGSKMQSLQEEASEKLNETLGLVGEAQQTLAAGLDDIVNNVITTTVEDMLSQTRAKVSEELKALLESAMGNVKNTLDNLAENIFDSKNGQTGAREMLEPLFNQLEGTIEPIESVINAVKDAASLVGMDFD